MEAQNDNLVALSNAGVSVWLDDLDRHRIMSGNLANLIASKSVVGVTTNPSIFEKALTSGVSEYSTQLRELAESGASVDEAVRALTVADVQSACDVFADVFQASGGVDGRVSLEVDPRLAHDTDGTIAQAVELWNAVDRPNLLVKIPATKAGLPAIREVLGRGISVNVTLIFSLERYREVMDMWLDGLDLALTHGIDVATIESVASFFVSRVDTLVDAQLQQIGTSEAAQLLGKAALANAHLAWDAYLDVTSSARWSRLAQVGARVQRPLWASTGVKDPSLPDTLYVIELVAPNSVNTMPEATLNAVADHGVVRGDTVTGTADAARVVWAGLEAAGIDRPAVFDTLEREGVDKFIGAWTNLLTSVTSALEAAR